MGGWWRGVCDWVDGGGVFVNGWVVEGCLCMGGEWRGVCDWVDDGGVFVNGWVVEGCL